MSPGRLAAWLKLVVVWNGVTLGVGGLGVDLCYSGQQSDASRKAMVVAVMGHKSALVLAIVLGILNLFVKPILIILTLPITIFTFGLFLFVINALIILLAAKFVNGFHVDGFWWALLFSLLLSVLTSFLYKRTTQKGN